MIEDIFQEEEEGLEWVQYAQAETPFSTQYNIL